MMGNTVVEYYPSCVIRRIPTGITCFGSNPFMFEWQTFNSRIPPMILSGAMVEDDAVSKREM